MSQNAIAAVVCALVWSSSALGAEPAREPRVRQAYENQLGKVERLFKDKGLPFPPAGIYLRAFKQEAELELWGKRSDGERYDLVARWPICASSGKLGPKRREGDLQVPEGFYEINHFNPRSNFHLSLGVSYPNRSDRILGNKGNLGGAIYVHGACVTIGCIPLGDELIEQLYVAASEARAAGQQRIPIDIFPARLTDENLRALAESPDHGPELVRFWQDLKPGFDLFEQQRKPPCVCVLRDGSYGFGSSCAALGAAASATRKPSGCRWTR
ncbi:MAG: L,D-transpeptidase family protein [Myxococcales bacterium]|jgi:murein L,D-transpeptidase YafK